MVTMTSYVGRIKTVEPFEVYQKYLALKRHFTSDSYDYHKYNGKVKANKHSFDIRKDKYFFYKLSKIKHVEEFLLANFVDGDSDFWVGQMSDDKVNDVYENYRKRQQSLTYTFKSDLAKMKDDFDSNIIVPDNEHPYLLRLYMRKDICIETLTILDMLCIMYKYWDRKLHDDVIWPQVKMKSNKYRPFLSVDINKYKAIVTERFT
jgi:hypothetical protein